MCLFAVQYTSFIFQKAYVWMISMTVYQLCRLRGGDPQVEYGHHDCSSSLTPQHPHMSVNFLRRPISLLWLYSVCKNQGNLLTHADFVHCAADIAYIITACVLRHIHCPDHDIISNGSIPDWGPSLNNNDDGAKRGKSYAVLLRKILPVATTAGICGQELGFYGCVILEKRILPNC
jgi:hypothetical protein